MKPVFNDPAWKAFCSLATFRTSGTVVESADDRGLDVNGGAGIALAAGVPQLYYSNLRRHGLEARADGGLVERMRAARIDTLNKVFLKEGPPFLLLKGAACIVGVYKDDSLRRLSDLDILIRPSDARRAALGLKKAGWRVHAPAKHGVFINHGQEFSAISPQGVEVDIHFRLFPWYWEKHVFGFDSGAMWEGAVSAEREGASFRMPAPEYGLLYALMNIVVECGALRYWLDADAVIREHSDKMRWELFSSLAGTGRIRERYRRVLMALKCELGTPLPDGLVAPVSGHPGGGGRLEEPILYKAVRSGERGRKGPVSLSQNAFDKAAIAGIYLKWQSYKHLGMCRDYFIRHNNPDPHEWEMI